MKIGSGTFTGVGSYADPSMLRGAFTLVKEGDRIRFTTSDDFFFIGTPSPGFAVARGDIESASNQAQQAADTDFLRLPNSGSSDPSEQLAVNGAFTGLLKDGTDVDNADSIFLWCYLGVLLGVGPIVRE